MDKLNHASTELREMDNLAALSSPIHNLHPLSKLIVTLSYIFLTVSFNKYDFSGLIVMLLYPVAVFSVSGISIRKCFYKLRFVLPLVCAVGLFNPFFDKVPLVSIGTVTVSGGVISMITLMLKGVFCLMASFILVATTTIDAICAALRKIHIPNMIVTLLLLTYRYIAVMIDEVSVMSTAYKLRAPGQKGIHHSAWGSFLGQLLLRSMDKAEELYSCMLLRGFRGEFPYADVAPAKLKDYLYPILVVGAFILCRLFNIAALFGGIALGG